MRNYIATGLCLVSGAYALVLLHRDGQSAWWIALQLSCAWFVIADWLGRRLWLLSLKIGSIHKEAKRGNMRLTGLALGIHRCALVMFGTAVVKLFA